MIFIFCQKSLVPFFDQTLQLQPSKLQIFYNVGAMANSYFGTNDAS